MAPKVTKATKESTKSKKKKSVDKVPKLENVQHDQMVVSEYFGQYRIVDEAELSFRCTAKDSIATKKWFGGIEWSFAKYGKDKTSLTCNSWEKGSKVLVDLHFYCLPDKDSHLPMITETYKRQELTMGSEIEMENRKGLSLSCSVTWGVYVRVLKAWDVEKRPWNDPESKYTLLYFVRGRQFYVLKDFMASVSKFIQDNIRIVSTDLLNVDHAPHEFDVFLHAIDGTDPVLPAPDTIRFLANYADDYSIPTLMAKCEEHLKYCHEIPLIERLKMAFDYDMKGAQGYLVGMITNSEWTRAKVGDEREKFDALMDAEPNFYEKVFDMEHLC
jgi:hypothetical protein